MKDFIDTNLLLRYLRGSPEDHRRRAQALIDSDTLLYVTEVVLLETAYALRTQFGATREEIVDALLALVQKDNISVLNLEREVVVEALHLCRPSHRVSFGDALIWAAVRCAQPARLYSFDERFPSADIELRRP
jgi:predicted nucleic acid-binding protein